MASLVAGSLLFLVNSVILGSLCWRRGVPGPVVGRRWDRAGDRGADSTECLSAECHSTPDLQCHSTPDTPHLLPTFSTPGRVSRTASLHRQVSQVTVRVPCVAMDALDVTDILRGA